jgi:two-component system nitrate/nitrite response regulator NarL
MTPTGEVKLDSFSGDRKAAVERARVILIDDHRLCRQGLAELLERSGDFTVLGSTADPTQAQGMVRELAPDLVVMDLRMPVMDGLSLLGRLREQGCEAAVVILTMSDLQDDMANALRAGVRGYLLKDMDPEDLLDSIRRTARGELVVAPAMAVKLSNLLQHNAPDQPKEQAPKLTEREKEILRHLARGSSNKAIAKALSISHDTVKLHVRHILAKLNMSSRVEAAVFAVEQGVAPRHTHDAHRSKVA